MGHEHHHGSHHHGPVHLGDADWAAMAERTEREGEVLLGFVDEAIACIEARRGPAAAPVRRILDIGSGPGVGSCELATRFPDATVVALDGSAAMLTRATERAERLGVAGRVSTLQAELPDGFDALASHGPFDLVWASMSLHHVADEVAVIRRLAGLLAPRGILAVAEVAAPLRVLPEPPPVGTPGLAARLDAASAAWFVRLRAGLTGHDHDSTPQQRVVEAGLRLVHEEVLALRFDAPLPDDRRAFAREQLARGRAQLIEHLDAADLAALDALITGEHAGDELFVDASRLLLLAEMP